MTVDPGTLTDRELLMLMISRNQIDHVVLVDVPPKKAAPIEIEGEAGYVLFNFNEDGRLLKIVGDR